MNISQWVCHLHLANVSPASDYSGKGVWTATQPLPYESNQANEHFAYNGLTINKPESLGNLRSGLVDIQGQQYKAATASFQAAEYDEQETFADMLSTFQAKDCILLVHGWGPDSLGVATNGETRVYWCKVLNAAHIEFAVFAAGMIKMGEKGAVHTQTFHDYKLGSSKGVETPAGRCTSIKSDGLWPQELFAASPEEVNTSPLKLG